MEIGARRKAVEHEITFEDGKVCRDETPVRITGNKHVGSLKIGCTEVSRAALIALMKMSDDCISSDEVVFQEGVA
jgi:hypothetical protein